MSDGRGIWVLRLFAPLTLTFPDFLDVGWGIVNLTTPRLSTVIKFKSDPTSHFSEGTYILALLRAVVLVLLHALVSWGPLHLHLVQ